MDIEAELNEAWNQAAQLQQKLMADNDSLESGANRLETRVTKLAKAAAEKKKKASRIELLAHLCLLSEICSALDFDRMIVARERFQAIYPAHFTKYLSHLDTLSWNTSWSGCLECRHFSGRCNLNLIPVDAPDSISGLEKHCPQKTKRSRHL